MQSRKASVIETVTNLAVGFVISVAVGHFLFRAMGHPLSMAENVFTTLVYTAISFVRGYFVRRAFNQLHQKGILQ